MHASHRLVRLLTILVLGGLTLGVCLVALAPGVSTLAASAHYTGKVGPQLRPLDGPTTLYDANGNVMDRLGNVYRTPAPLRDVPKVLVDAVIATEDRTFFENPGVDLRSTVRALLSNVHQGGIGQGGSTITQQLIKNRYFTNPKRDLNRKVREAILAARLTDEWSKRRILEEYLNTVYFGENAYGVSEAANRIIGRPLHDLDLADAALLAGLIKNPSAYDPFHHPGAATHRRDEVLRGMVTAKKITAAQAKIAGTKAMPVQQDCVKVTLDPTCDELRAHTPYAEEVKNRLLGLKELGPDEQAAAQRVFAGGLKVYTAYRPDLTAIATNAIESTIGKFEPRYTAAMAVMDPHTGEVVAIASGKQATSPQGYNLATMGPSTQGGRQVGSTFKPITLATAFENNQYSPRDVVDGGSPCYITYLPWHYVKVKQTNAADGSGGTADLFSQTRNSVNCAFLNLFTSVGPPKVLEMAHRLGYVRPVEEHITTGVGQTAHSPLEVATMFSTLASEGIHHDPIFIRRVEDSTGRVLYRAPGGNRALDAQTARTVTDVLSHVTEGTAPHAKLPDDRPLAGKTGTLDREVDAWFAGYTPQLVAAVWMGNPLYEDADKYPQASMSNVGGVTVFGGTYPTTIWQKFMSTVLDGQPIVQFTKPDETLWPKPARVNPDGGRGDAFSDVSGAASSSTSSSTPVDSSSTSSSTSSTSPPPSTSSTTKPTGP
ncbi:MAG: transglycosylase domain-containing protein [Acidimicrobiia bacterium]